MDFNIGDRVMWESQAGGSWKRKYGTVISVLEENLLVDVDTIVNFNPETWKEEGELKTLRKTRRYSPRKKFCKLITKQY